MNWKPRSLETALAFGLLVSLALLPSPLEAEVRTWTNAAGKTLEAELISATPSHATLKLRANGQRYEVPLTSLSEADQAFVGEWLEKQTSSSASAATPGENFDAPWPKLISSDVDPEIEVVEEDEEKGSYIYRSPRYEFVCNTKLSKSVVKRFAVLFEATNDYMREMPFSMAKPHTDKLHRIELYETERSYFSAGGPPGSAGVYMSAKDTIMVPLTSLGVEKVGNRFIVDHDKGNKTLPHEITHQLTDRVYYVPGALGWFTEGMAEYVGVTPYRSGKFTVSTVMQYLKEYDTAYGKDNSGGRALGEEIRMPPIEQWFLQSYGSFVANGSLNYGSAALIFYYFAHMDGDKDGARLRAFCRGIKEGKAGEEALAILLDGRSYDELEEDITKSWRSRGVKFEFPE